jgi:hypothetical protein
MALLGMKTRSQRELNKCYIYLGMRFRLMYPSMNSVDTSSKSEHGLSGTILQDRSQMIWKERSRNTNLIPRKSEKDEPSGAKYSRNLRNKGMFLVQVWNDGRSSILLVVAGWEDMHQGISVGSNVNQRSGMHNNPARVPVRG